MSERVPQDSNAERTIALHDVQSRNGGSVVM
jgi:hypothetical protein